MVLRINTAEIDAVSVARDDTAVDSAQCDKLYDVSSNAASGSPARNIAQPVQTPSSVVESALSDGVQYVSSSAASGSAARRNPCEYSSAASGSAAGKKKRELCRQRPLHSLRELPLESAEILRRLRRPCLREGGATEREAALTTKDRRCHEKGNV